MKNKFKAGDGRGAKKTKKKKKKKRTRILTRLPEIWYFVFFFDLRRKKNVDEKFYTLADVPETRGEKCSRLKIPSSK